MLLLAVKLDSSELYAKLISLLSRSSACKILVKFINAELLEFCFKGTLNHCVCNLVLSRIQLGSVKG